MEFSLLFHSMISCYPLPIFYMYIMFNHCSEVAHVNFANKQWWRRARATSLGTAIALYESSTNHVS